MSRLQAYINASTTPFATVGAVDLLQATDALGDLRQRGEYFGEVLAPTPFVADGSYRLKAGIVAGEQAGVGAG